jgi:hypothetical protein
MKSRQRSSKRKQRFSDGWQSAVLKQQDSTTNSTALSPEITKLETVGQIPTDKECISCSVPLTKDNWYDSFVAKKHYKCKTCYDIRRVENRIKRGERSPSLLAKLFNWKTQEVYNQVKEGYVYLMTNPAWPEWVKVGMAVDSEDRIKSYQTSSPFRDYTLVYSYEVDDRRAAESAAHVRLAKECDNINEWFKLPPPIANELIMEVIHEY